MTMSCSYIADSCSCRLIIHKGIYVAFKNNERVDRSVFFGKILGLSLTKRARGTERGESTNREEW